MAGERRRWRRWTLYGLAGSVVLLLAASWYWRDDIARTGLDPKTPFQTYQPPPAPNYAQADAWALLPAHPAQPGPETPGADVFFVHPTTFDGGKNWNAPIGGPGGGHSHADRMVSEVMLPNYAGPFARVGRVFAPRYRQASLYATQMTLRDDAREARVFAYRDVRAAFDAYLARWGDGRPFILAGVEQGGQLVTRLAREVQADPALKDRLIAVYAMEVVSLAEREPPLCRTRSDIDCRVAYVSARAGDFTAKARLLDRAQVWSAAGNGLDDLGRRKAACVNPLTGAVGESEAPARANLGAANATGLEWGARPALLQHQASARCDADGILRISGQRSPDLKRSGSWTDRLKVRGFNVFWADIEADALARRGAWFATRETRKPALP